MKKNHDTCIIIRIDKKSKDSFFAACKKLPEKTPSTALRSFIYETNRRYFASKEVKKGTTL